MARGSNPTLEALGYFQLSLRDREAEICHCWDRPKIVLTIVVLSFGIGVNGKHYLLQKSRGPEPEKRVGSPLSVMPNRHNLHVIKARTVAALSCSFNANLFSVAQWNRLEYMARRSVPVGPVAGKLIVAKPVRQLARAGNYFELSCAIIWIK